MISIAVETSIILKNMKDAEKIDIDISEKPNLYKRFINIFSKKDPLLQALLFENAITFTSTMVPIVC